MNNNPIPEESRHPTKRPHNRALRFGLALGVLVAMAVSVGYWFTQPSKDQLLQESRLAFTQGNFLQARKLSEELLRLTPNSPEANLINGQVAFALGYCAEAEEAFRRVLQTEPANREAHLGFVRLLKMEARYWELEPHALGLLRWGDSGSEFLLPLAAPDALELSEEELRQADHCRATVPDDPLPMLGMARFLLKQNQAEQAQNLLTNIVAHSPQQLEAQVQWGSLLLESHQNQAFLDWHFQLPPQAEAHPGIWFLRGLYAIKRQQPKVAARCFWEALLRDPNHRQANYQLSQVLRATGEGRMAKPFSMRFEQLEELARLATKGDDTSRNSLSPRVMLRIAELMEVLGRFREALAWDHFALKHDPSLTDAEQRIASLKKRIDELAPLTLASHQPALQSDFSDHPLPDWSTTNTVPAPLHSAQGLSDVKFLDVAESVGLKFTYQNGADPASGLARMFEFSGGGVAVLDYNDDSWPDLYLTQGCRWPPGSGNARYQDRLFRNLGGERFEDVTAQAGLGDEGYSQGATVGDVNNDGFPDLYVGNIGSNRLYLNNGDGTFEDVTNSLGIGGEDWTISCLIADLNNDALPDIYCVNYLSGSEIFTRRCEREGRLIQCPLHYFPSAQDRVYLNRGDGRFEDVTESSGIAVPDGKGMGIVAGRFNETDGFSLFIANDDTPNFYFVPNEKNSAESLSLSNQSVISGLAYGDLGSAQSCMGVAAGDANNDGLLDLYVTNFTNEPNTLYLQQPGGVFTDKAREAGLHLPTLRQMGWGTQFLDADLDGLLDLVAANGHLDENTSGSFPYKMPAQFFRNMGNHRFQEVSGSRLGSYFERFHAGRAVARIDWNRDGLDDCCITHVDAPVALLSNQTAKTGNCLVIRLRGVHCSRDAIGSVVRVTAGNQTIVRHLTAGDGFQASNERKLTFGIEPGKRIDNVTISWPSGMKQPFVPPNPNAELIVIEGQLPLPLGTTQSNSPAP